MSTASAVRQQGRRHSSGGDDDKDDDDGRLNSTRRKVEARSRDGGDFKDDTDSPRVTTENTATAVSVDESALPPPPPPSTHASFLSTPPVEWVRDLPRSLWTHVILELLALDDIYIARVTCRTMLAALATAAGRRFAIVATRLLPRLGLYAHRDLDWYGHYGYRDVPYRAADAGDRKESRACADQQWRGRLVECCCVAVRYLPALAAAADVERKLGVFCKSSCLPEAIVTDELPGVYLHAVPRDSDVEQLRFVLRHIRTRYFDELLQRRAPRTALQSSPRPAPSSPPPPPSAYIYVRRCLERLGITPDSQILTRCWTWLLQDSVSS